MLAATITNDPLASPIRMNMNSYDDIEDELVQAFKWIPKATEDMFDDRPQNPVAATLESGGTIAFHPIECVTLKRKTTSLESHAYMIVRPAKKMRQKELNQRLVRGPSHDSLSSLHTVEDSEETTS
jgi:hypothetical protein